MVRLPQGKPASARPYDNPLFFHEPQLEQLDDEHPPHDEAPAEDETVSPPAPRLKNPQADMSRFTSGVLHSGQTAFSFPRISASNFLSHDSQ